MYTAFKCKQRVAKKLKAVKVTIGKSMALKHCRVIVASAQLGSICT